MLTLLHIIQIVYICTQLTGSLEALVIRAPTPMQAPSYLNTKRPLWILEDQVRKQDDYGTHVDHDFSAKLLQHTPAVTLFLRRRETDAQRPVRTRGRWPTTKRLGARGRLYMPYNRSMEARLRQVPRTAYSRVSSEVSTMPTFDGVPGADSEAPAPVFIYNGPKGELILNTMLSTQRYPMHEPIPGQVLYPPVTPMFKPKPIVEHFRALAPAITPLNLTLIPFYAHEAINAPITGFTSNVTSSTKMSTTNAPTIIYETQVKPTSSRHRDGRNRRRKKAKQYTAYHSADEVQWMPVLPAPLERRRATPFPLTTAMSLENHRHQSSTDMDSTELEENSNDQHLEYPESHKTTPTTAATEHSDFQIVYLDSSNEQMTTTEVALKPTTLESTEPVISMPRLSSRYTLQKEYYAFPVFTISKLIQPTTTAIQSTDTSMATSDQPTSAKTSSHEQTQNVDTWFILNSRYKGPYKPTNSPESDAQSTKSYYTSKYIQNPAIASPNAII